MQTALVMVNAINCIDEFVKKLHKHMQDETHMRNNNAERLCKNIDQ
jgi:hypothetical protein